MDTVEQLKLSFEVKENPSITFKDKLAEVSELSDNFKIWCSQ